MRNNIQQKMFNYNRLKSGCIDVNFEYGMISNN